MPKFSRRDVMVAAVGGVAILPLRQTLAAAREITLTLPRALRPGDTVAIEVTLGPLARDEVISLSTGSDQPLGTISPFGPRAGQEGGTYALPVPLESIRDGRLTVLLTIIRDGSAPRAPTTNEVRSVRLLVR